MYFTGCIRSRMDGGIENNETKIGSSFNQINIVMAVII